MARVGWLLPALLGIAVACGDDGAGNAGGESSSGGETGAADEESSTGEAPTFCEGPTALLYDPAGGGVEAFPDDFYTVDDDTPTGLRVDLRPGENVATNPIIDTFARVYGAASTLDGFGTTAGAFVQFSGPIDGASLPDPSGLAAPTDAVLLIDLDAEPPMLVPFEWKSIAEDREVAQTTLVVEPMAPLQPVRRYALLVTTRVLDLGGDCIAPSPAMLALLDGSAPADLTRIQPGVDEAVQAAIDLGAVASPTELTAAVTFTTQHTFTDSAAIAAEIQASEPPTFTPGDTPCEAPEGAAYTVCEGTFDALDFTGADEAVPDDLQPQGGYELTAKIWLPTSGDAPFPVVIFGHGLSGDRHQGDRLADFAAPQGWAAVAIDAPKHGDHPDSGGLDVLEFFGLSLDLADPLDALKARDNWRQGAYDKLQLLELLLAGVDADDDGSIDLDPDRIHYLGVSLGGIMAPEFLAFTNEVDTATVIVPGARVTGMVENGESFSTIVDYFKTMATDGEVARFFPLLQTVMDRGDAGVYAPFVVANRIEGFDGQRPDVLMQMVIDDDTVPNSTNRFYARAMQTPHVGEALQAVAGVSHEPALPIARNMGDRTAGVFQFDVLEGGNPATHGNVAESEVAQAQAVHFIETHLSSGVAEILDPYELLGLK